MTLGQGKWLLLFATLPSVGLAQEPVKVTICQLQSEPTAYNRKLVQVSGSISHSFEDFTLVDSTCDSWPRIWLEYGGPRNSNTIYCCGTTAGAKRKNTAMVEGITIPLSEDRWFRDFRRLVDSNRPFHAEIVGRFFAGRVDATTSGFRGYGHLGCCSLLMIQRVLSATASR